MQPPAKPTQPPRADLLATFAIFAASAVVFLSLRTQQYLAVDGALRCLSVYWTGHPVAGGNNHLLYFVNVFLWTRTLSLAGLRALDAFDFVRLTHIMNALAAAASVAMLSLLSYRATAGRGVALAVAIAYAFANAFLLHATSTAEPMMGLLWSFTSVLIVVWSLSTSSRLGLLIGGSLLLLAMATYESMVLIGPAELVLIYYWDKSSSHSRTSVLFFLAGCLLGGLAIYIPTYALSGTTGMLAMSRRFLDTGGGAQVYGGVRPSKLLNLPMGFANSLLPCLPPDYQGIRALLTRHRHDRWIVLTPIAVVLLLGWLAWTLRRLAMVWRRLERLQRLSIAACAIALACDLLALIFWDPIYDKLWLQPLAVILLAWSVIFAAWRQSYRPRLLLIPELLLLALIVPLGLADALDARLSPTPCLAATRKLAAQLRSSDLLVTEWDPVSLLYSSFWADGAHNFNLPGSATDNGARALPLLDDAIASALAAGGNVYFLGVLDLPQDVWQPYLADRCHLPYHSLDGLRRCAQPSAKITCAGRDQTLWQLPPGCYRP